MLVGNELAQAHEEANPSVQLNDDVFGHDPGRAAGDKVLDQLAFLTGAEPILLAHRSHKKALYGP